MKPTDLKTINELTVIARKLTPCSVAITEVAGSHPTIDQVVSLVYNKFHKNEVLKGILYELNQEGFEPEKIYAGFPLSVRQDKISKGMGKIMVEANPLSQFSPSKYESLILKHLTVNVDGVVVRK